MKDNKNATTESPTPQNKTINSNKIYQSKLISQLGKNFGNFKVRKLRTLIHVKKLARK